MKRIPVITILVFLLGGIMHAQQGAGDSSKLSMLFMGDIMGHDEQIWSAENRETGEYNYDDVFKYIKPRIARADLAIGNLEVTLGGPPYKGYPAFSSPAALAAACKNAGIDCLVTANNHSADRGKKGIISTIARLDSLGIPHTGTFVSRQARDSLSPLMIEKNGFRIALLNYTYGTNGIRVPPPVIVNLINRDSIAGDLSKARRLSPDLTIVFLHWGVEYDTVPRKDQVELADFLFENGADLVIGSHPHVIQRMEWEKKTDSLNHRVVAYSLGNFVSNQRKSKTDGGTMIMISAEKRGGEVTVTDASYMLTWVYTPIEKYRKKFFILPCDEFVNKTDFFANKADYNQMKRFINGSQKLLNGQNVNIPEYSFYPPHLTLNY